MNWDMIEESWYRLLVQVNNGMSGLDGVQANAVTEYSSIIIRIVCNILFLIKRNQIFMLLFYSHTIICTVVQC